MTFRSACPVPGASTDTPGVVPPPLIYGPALLVGIGLDWLWPAPVLPNAVQYWTGGIVTALSFVLVALVLREFVRARTSFSSHRPSTALITSGPFRLSRNPAYVSLTMLYAGIGIAADSPWILALGIVAVAITHFAVIKREERYLDGKFGEAYLSYKASVRRWL